MSYLVGSRKSKKEFISKLGKNISIQVSTLSAGWLMVMWFTDLLKWTLMQCAKLAKILQNYFSVFRGFVALVNHRLSIVGKTDYATGNTVIWKYVLHLHWSENGWTKYTTSIGSYRMEFKNPLQLRFSHKIWRNRNVQLQPTISITHKIYKKRWFVVSFWYSFLML